MKNRWAQYFRSSIVREGSPGGCYSSLWWKGFVERWVLRLEWIISPGVMGNRPRSFLPSAQLRNIMFFIEQWRPILILSLSASTFQLLPLTQRHHHYLQPAYLIYVYHRPAMSAEYWTLYVIHTLWLVYITETDGRIESTTLSTTRLKQAVGGRPPRYAPAPLLPRWRRSALRRRADGNVASVSHGHTFPRPPLQLRDAPTRRWAKRPGDLDLWPFDLESGIRVKCDVGYLCVNFSLHRPLCSRLRPDVHDRQTDIRQTDRQTDIRRQTYVRQHHRFMPPPIRGGA